MQLTCNNRRIRIQCNFNGKNFGEGYNLEIKIKIYEFNVYKFLKKKSKKRDLMELLFVYKLKVKTKV